VNVDSPITLAQALLMAVLQGVTELFPISSLGHAVVVPHLLGWNLDPRSTAFLPFLVALHLGTGVALAIYFWRDWWALLSSLLPGSSTTEIHENRYLLLLLVIGTVPAGLLGLLLEKRLTELFGQYRLVAIFLVLNGILLFAGEWLRRRKRFQELSHLHPVQAFAIGISQAIALLPGFSRSGASLAGGLLVGLTHESAARFSFLLSTPIILAAGALELPKLLQTPTLGPALAGGLVAGVIAYISTAILMRYFKTHESNALLPFGVYCIGLGVIAMLIP
jgi:undecaprenyl-diphosphatase